MPAEIVDWTAEMARALPDDGRRHEVLDGALVVTPAPSLLHQELVGAFYRRLYPYVMDLRLGRVIFAPAEVEFSRRRLLQPDLFVVPPVDGRAPERWTDVRRILLALEVLSPSSVRVDRFQKRAIYSEEGVPEYWIAHPEARLVERWRPDGERPDIFDETIEWQPVSDVPPLVIDLEELFAEAGA